MLFDTFGTGETPTNLLNRIPIRKFLFFLLMAQASTVAFAQKFNSDVYETSPGNLTISFIGHETLMFQFNGKTIQVDPWSKLADYGVLPKADIILITHAHGDHLDTAAIRKTSKAGTLMITTAEVAEKIKQGRVMKKGETRTVLGLVIKPIVVYPYNYGETDLNKVKELLKPYSATKFILKNLK